MIRLVAADMDGTLLNSRKELPNHLFSTIHQLSKRKILFAVASGRQYYNLRQIFEPVGREVLFLCENGSMVYAQDKLLYASRMKDGDIMNMAQAVRPLAHARVVLCGVESAYTDCRDPEDLHYIKKYFDRLKVTEDFAAVLRQDIICKVSVLERGLAETSCYPALARFSNRLQVSLSGENWADVMNFGVNKGSAIQQIQQKYGISPAESMSFGDYLNDVQMQCQCYHSYAMANAHEQLKRVSRSVCPSNDENGVLRTLQSVFSLNFNEQEESGSGVRE